MEENSTRSESLKIDAQFEKATKDLTQLGTDIIQYCENSQHISQLNAIKKTVEELIEETEIANLAYATMNDGKSNQYYDRFRSTAEGVTNTITIHVDTKLENTLGTN